MLIGLPETDQAQTQRTQDICLVSPTGYYLPAEEGLVGRQKHIPQGLRAQKQFFALVAGPWPCPLQPQRDLQGRVSPQPGQHLRAVQQGSGAVPCGGQSGRPQGRDQLGGVHHCMKDCLQIITYGCPSPTSRGHAGTPKCRKSAGGSSGRASFRGIWRYRLRC